MDRNILVVLNHRNVILKQSGNTVAPYSLYPFTFIYMYGKRSI